MRTSTFLTAAFAGVALSSPLVKRDTVVEIDTVVDVVYVTKYVTETAGAAPATSVVAPTSTVEEASSSTAEVKSLFRNRFSWSKVRTSQAATSSVVASSSVASSSTPVVVVSTSSAPVVVVPTTTETSATSSATIPAAEVSLSTTFAPSSVVIGAVKTSSSPSLSSSSPLTTSMALEARAAVPTCNVYNVASVKSQKPYYSNFCTNWRAAKTHSAPVTVTGLSNAQISNICNCLLAPTYVAKTPAQTATAKLTSYKDIVVAHHNVHRANHSAPALTWSDDLASTAATIAASCKYAHNVAVNGGGYGQNIAAGVPAANVSYVITDLFYNGEVNYFDGLYGQANPSMDNFDAWGHFSQIVWKDTTQVGCYTQDCSASGLANTGQYVSPYFTVCNYKSPGNYGGEYADNIGASLKKATVNWSYGL